MTGRIQRENVVQTRDHKQMYDKASGDYLNI